MADPQDDDGGGESDKLVRNPKEWTVLDSKKPPWEKGCFIAGVSINDHQLLAIVGSDLSKMEDFIMEAFDRDGMLTSSCLYFNSRIQDSRTQKWRKLEIDLRDMLTDFGVARVNDTVFVIGGVDCTLGRAITRKILSIDIPGRDVSVHRRKSWSFQEYLPEPRAAFACVSHSYFIYVFGGYDGDHNPVDTALRYNTQTNEWFWLDNMPGGPRFVCSAGVVGHRIFVVGGTNLANDALASTIVFDTSKQKWESLTAEENDADGGSSTPAPAVPDMSTERAGLSVVVVDRFVVAVGGENRNKTKLFTIEVLDTERNRWKIAPRKLKRARRNHFAGFLEGTKELVVAGGNDGANDTTEIIDFYKGLLPAEFLVRERGQEFTGDRSRGEDKLDIDVVAEVMVEMLIDKNMKDPFVLGVLGRWGLGKSYFFNRMKEHIIKFQKRRADKFYQENFAGHIFVVEFDAWTYSKGVIASSLMYEILKTLNEQLQLEQIMGTKILEEGNLSTLEVLRDFSTEELNYFEKKHPDISAKYLKIKKNGDVASDVLLKAIYDTYENDANELQTTENEIKALEADLETQKKNLREVFETKKLDRRKELEKKKRNVLAETAASEIYSVMNSYGKKALEDALVNLQNDIEMNTLIEDIEKIKGTWYYSWSLWNLTPITVIFSTLLLIVALTLILTFRQDIVGGITVFLSVLTPFVSLAKKTRSAMDQFQPVVNNLRRIQCKIDTNLSEYEAELSVFDEECSADLQNELTDIENKLRVAIIDMVEKVKEIEKRTLSFAAKGSSLRETIATKIDKKVYEGNLGITHKVQQDLQLISDAMTNKNHYEKQDDSIFPRGEPRIILVVDDLDRCDHHTVVEVIEALQLLVKTQLFVAILAIDPRYVTSSIEKHYQNVLDIRNPPSGMDFLEKIIQIPYRLTGVRPDTVDAFIRSQVQIEEPPKAEEVSEDSVTSDDKEATTIVPTSTKLAGSQKVAISVSDFDVDTSFRSVEEETPKAEEVSEDSVTSDSDADQTGDEALPSLKSFLPEAEVEMMIELFELFGLGPRCMKRIVNVYKALQVIWKRVHTKRKFEVDDYLKRATLFLMLLASEESTREVSFRIFYWMENGAATYHHVAVVGEGAQRKNNLANLFTTKLIDSDSKFKRSLDDKGEAREGTLMFYIKEYLSKYEWENLQKWNEISSKLKFARNFTFYRLVHEEEENKLRILGVEPQAIKQIGAPTARPSGVSS